MTAKRELKFWQKAILWGVGVLLIIGIFVVGSWFPFYASGKKLTDLKPNEFGDSFGFLNALMSSLAFIGVLATLWMQRQELALQRQEMRDSREELRKSAEAQKEMVEMQLFQSYLNGLSTMVNRQGFAKPMTPPTTKDQYSLDVGYLSELERMLDRVRHAAHDIVGRKPIDRNALLDRIKFYVSSAMNKLSNNKTQEAEDIIYSLVEDIRLNIPAMDTSHAVDFNILNIVQLLWKLNNDIHVGSVSNRSYTEQYGDELKMIIKRVNELMINLNE